MNILIISHFDRSGGGHALAQAVNEHTIHQARQVCFERPYLEYPFDVLAPTDKEMLNLVEWADVLNLHDECNYLIPAGAPKRPVVATYHGTWYRRQIEKINRRDAEEGRIQTCTTLDMTQYGPEWLGRAMPDLSHMHAPDPHIFRVVQAPTWRRGKGTKDIVEAWRNWRALDSLDNTVFELVERLPHAECLRRKARAHLLIDQVRKGGALGYGANALEAWAMGMPVISSATDEICGLIEQEIGYLPFYRVSTVADVWEAVRRFRDDKKFYDEWKETGRHYVREWHDPAFVAGRFIEFCERATGESVQPVPAMKGDGVKISVCMIVRNEEAILAQALESTRGLADEVVVLDTGSEDGTLALAREAGCRVLTGGDRMNKGESRNRALDAARGEWVVVLDADERIADPEGLRRFLEETDAQAVYIRLAYMDGNDRPALSYQQMRCWRQDRFRYKYRAHEVPVPVDGWGKIAHTDFAWEHRPPPGRAWKLQYTLDRLLLDVEENPDDPRPLYYLGRQYMYMGEYGKSVKTLLAYIDTPGRVDRAEAWGCLANCYAELGDQRQQIQALHQACAEQPDCRNWWGNLASIYHTRGQDEIAAGLLKCALEMPSQNGYRRHMWHGAHIHDLLARCLWKLGRYDEGYEHAQKAAEMEPGNGRLQANFAFFKEKLPFRGMTDG